PHDHNTVYAGSQYVHATNDGGQTWKAISPDLTTGDQTMMGDSGGLTIDNLSVEYAGVVYSIAESPKEKGVIWAGTNDGLVQVTRDGGGHWDNVAKNMPGLPPKGTVDSVDPSPHDGGTCYVSVDFHQVDNRDPYIYKTTDYGKTWKAIASNIPKSPLSYVHVVREDPFRRGMLYVGTENALYVSFDDGGRREPLQSKLPHAPVYWLTVQPHFHDLVVGTYGRGFYILDDVTPLEQLTDAVRASSAQLFEPRPAYRFRAVARPNLAPSAGLSGKNAPYGALINYWLKEPVKKDSKEEDEGAAPKDPFAPKKKNPVEITILDSAGQKIRTIKGTNAAGINRVTWDLRYAPTEEVRLRTTPKTNPHIGEEKRFIGKDHRGVYYYGIDSPKRGPLAAPGTYTVKLTVEGQELTQKLVVRKDPNSAGTDADVDASAKFSAALYKDINTAAGMINQIEWTRKQLQDFQSMLAAEKKTDADVAPVKALDAQVRAVEDELLQPTLADADMKSFRGPLQLYLKLVWLQAESGTGGGDVSGNADFAPTQPEREVYDLLAGRLAGARKSFDELYQKTIPAFNDAMRSKGYVQLMTVTEPQEPRPQEGAPEEDDDDDWAR
ncbi:MAG TPA: hypothetical protein VF376_10350, partial [Thermoanaerobaculia bacterium]